MRRAVIFANGIIEQPHRLFRELMPSDIIIAADGGCLHCKSLGLVPNVIIGDFDSLSDEDLAKYQEANSMVIRYPTHKNETDLELALLYAIDQDLEEVLIFGALGARWDMTLANLLLLAHPAIDKKKIRVLDGTQEFCLIKGEDTLLIQGQIGETISLIPLAGDAFGITTTGLEYPLNDEILVFGTTRGISNVLQKEHAQISIKAGILMCIINRGKSNLLM